MTNTTHIWNPDTGITDLPAEIQHDFDKEYDLTDYTWQKNPRQLSSFYQKRNLLAAIETGQIERLYYLPASVVGYIVEHGLDGTSLDDDTRNLIASQKAVIEEAFLIVAESRPLTIEVIKRLHRQLTEHQDHVDAVTPRGQRVRIPLTKGEWKQHPNNVQRGAKRFNYCPPVSVQPQMELLLKWHDRHHASGVQADIAAAWLHHRFTQIHPFQDGNGRMARLLATIALLRGCLYPMTVLRQHMPRYIDALEKADAGDLMPLVKFTEYSQRAYLVAARPAEV